MEARTCGRRMSLAELSRYVLFGELLAGALEDLLGGTGLDEIPGPAALAGVDVEKTGVVGDALGLLAISDDGDGVVRAIEAALADARVHARDIGMIVAHGNGTVQSDATEAAALRHVFGDQCPPVTAFKWALGHLIAAAGILETTLALAAIRRQTVPGIATLDSVAPECAGVPLSRTVQRPRSDIALIVSRGFAGTDAALVVRTASA